MIVDRIAVTYPSMDEVLDRKEVIEDRVRGYIKDNPDLADNINTNIRVAYNKFILEVELIKEEVCH